MADTPCAVDTALACSVASFLQGIAVGGGDKVTQLRLSHQFLRDVWLHERPDLRRNFSPSVGEPVNGSLDGMELILSRIAQMSGEEDTMKVQDAKKWLRTLGEEGKSIASWIGSLSKVRNAQAHPRIFKILAALERLSIGSGKDKMDVAGEVAHDGRLLDLVGEWQSCDNPNIIVSKCPLGVLVRMSPDQKQFTKLEVEDTGVVLPSGLTTWKVIDMTQDEVLWEQVVGDLVWENGTMQHKIELRRITWNRKRAATGDISDTQPKVMIEKEGVQASHAAADPEAVQVRFAT
jgi:hypothetical protein